MFPWRAVQKPHLWVQIIMVRVRSASQYGTRVGGRTIVPTQSNSYFASAPFYLIKSWWQKNVGRALIIKALTYNHDGQNSKDRSSHENSWDKHHKRALILLVSYIYREPVCQFVYLLPFYVYMVCGLLWNNNLGRQQWLTATSQLYCRLEKFAFYSFIMWLLNLQWPKSF